jgi:hypothetical protein
VLEGIVIDIVCENTLLYLIIVWDCILIGSAFNFFDTPFSTVPLSTTAVMYLLGEDAKVPGNEASLPSVFAFPL